MGHLKSSVKMDEGRNVEYIDHMQSGETVITYKAEDVTPKKWEVGRC